MDWVSEVQETFAILKEAKEKVKKMKTFLKSEYDRRVRGKARKEGRTYLHFAAILGHVEAMKVLILDDAEVDAVDKSESTALHLAAWRGHVDVAKVLLENGAKVNAVDKIKRTALHRASRNGHVDVAKVLIQNGAKVNAVDKF